MSYTTQDEYFANLDILQNVNQPSYVLLPAAEKVYDINVNERTVDNKNIVVVEKDHKSKTIYFAIDKFNDYMDLSQTKCIIQYNVTTDNGEVKTKFYPVPFYDIYTKIESGKIVFPWNLDYQVTKKSGIIPFNIRFFKTGIRITENNDAELVLTYNLNIQPSQLKIEKGLNVANLSQADEEFMEANNLEWLMDYVDKTMQTLSRKIYWTVLSDDFSDNKIDVSAIQEDLSEILEQMEEAKKEGKD